MAALAADTVTTAKGVARVITPLSAAVVGGILGGGIRWIEQRAERRRRRRAIATALLNELRVTELQARQLLDMDRPADVAVGRVPIAAQILFRVTASDDLLLLQPATLSELMLLAQYVRLHEQLLDAYREHPPHGPTPTRHAHVRARAWYIAKRVPTVQAALLREGGTRPPPERIEALQGYALPPLGAYSFPEWQPPAAEKGHEWIDDNGRPGVPGAQRGAAVDGTDRPGADASDGPNAST